MMLVSMDVRMMVISPLDGGDLGGGMRRKNLQDGGGGSSSPSGVGRG
jgi:hypothetical protein